MEGARPLTDTLLQAASIALNTIRNKELFEIVAMMKPTDSVEELFKAIMILFNESQYHSWRKFIRMYGRSNIFMGNCIAFSNKLPG